MTPRTPSPSLCARTHDAIVVAVGVLVLLLGVTVGAGPARAQPSDGFNLDKAISRGPAPRRKAESPADRKVVKPPEATALQAEVQWGLRLAATDPAARDRTTDSFVTLSQQIGAGPLPYHAMALVEEAHVASDDGSAEVTEKLLDDADRLSPGLPNIAFARAAHTLETSPTSAFTLYGHLAEGWRRLVRWLPLRYAAQARAAQTSALIMTLVALALLALALYRYLRLAAADLGRLLPNGPSVPQLAIVTLLAIVAPGIVWSSPGLSVVLGLALMAAYMTWNERVAGVLVLACLTFLPGLSALGDAGLEFGGSRGHELWRMAAVGCDEACVEELKKEPAEGVAPIYAATRELLLANTTLRTSRTVDYGDAERRFRLVVDDATLPAELRSVAQNNLAVALAMEGKPEEAVPLLLGSVGAQPDAWGPHFNLFRLHEDGQRTAEAQASLDRAIALGGPEIARRSQVTDRSLNLWYVVLDVPTGPLATVHDQLPRSGAWMAGRWSVGAGEIPMESAGMVGVGSMVGFLLFLILGVALRASRRCPRCGQEMQRGRPGPREDVKGVCHTCRTCFAGGKMTYQQKVEHEDRAVSYEVRCRWVFRIGNVLVPGLGSALRGYAAGLWAVVLLAMGVAWLLTSGAWVPSSWEVTTWWFDGLSVVGWGLVLIGTVLGWIAFWLGDPGAPDRTDAGEIVTREEA